MEIKEDKRSKMEIEGDKDQYILWMYSTTRLLAFNSPRNEVTISL